MRSMTNEEELNKKNMEDQIDQTEFHIRQQESAVEKLPLQKIKMQENIASLQEQRKVQQQNLQKLLDGETA